MVRCPSLLGLMALTLGALAVAALAREPTRPALPPAAPAGADRAPTLSGPRLATVPALAFHVRFSLN
jgi:hypothetical protein